MMPLRKSVTHCPGFDRSSNKFTGQYCCTGGYVNAPFGRAYFSPLFIVRLSAGRVFSLWSRSGTHIPLPDPSEGDPISTSNCNAFTVLSMLWTFRPTASQGTRQKPRRYSLLSLTAFVHPSTTRVVSVV